ncbi:hypothetical protein BK139_12905 [Paenibacillus sp. FSL R5-0490]|nr:hypothetical protein BK139_12905 [Paenibacillus sp. FSL R5-0490]
MGPPGVAGLFFVCADSLGKRVQNVNTANRVRKLANRCFKLANRARNSANRTGKVQIASRILQKDELHTEQETAHIEICK